MNKTIGFIGSGNMGGAIMGGIIQSGLVKAENIIASDIMEASLKQLEEKYSIRTTKDNVQVAKESDILFLAVKPHIYSVVIKEIKTLVKEDVIIVMIAAGQMIGNIEKQFERPVKIVRTMPNTPALVSEGMTAICPNNHITENELLEVSDIFNSIGKTEIISESMMDVVTAMSGSSPAYVYMFIEAMADAGVSEGMPRAQAYRFAAQSVLGAAKMVLDTGEHPGYLKDMVCSPGGTTIAAVCELEKHGLRNAVISGVRACVNKSREMSK